MKQEPLNPFELDEKLQLQNCQPPLPHASYSAAIAGRGFHCGKAAQQDMVLPVLFATWHRQIEI